MFLILLKFLKFWVCLSLLVVVFGLFCHFILFLYHFIPFPTEVRTSTIFHEFQLDFNFSELLCNLNINLLQLLLSQSFSNDWSNDYSIKYPTKTIPTRKFHRKLIEAINSAGKIQTFLNFQIKSWTYWNQNLLIETFKINFYSKQNLQWRNWRTFLIPVCYSSFCVCFFIFYKFHVL